MNAAQLAIDSLDKYGDYVAYQFEGRDYTAEHQMAYAARLAGVLRERGICAGDRVMVLMPNRPEVLACFQAIWRLGAVITPVTPQLGAREVGYVLAHSEAKAVITSPDLTARVHEAAAGAPACEHILVLGDGAIDGATNITPLIDAAAPVETIHDCAPGDMAFLLYTSGTTGQPKGVMLSHNNIIANHTAVSTMGRMRERSQTILALPLSHSFGVLMMDLCTISACSAAVLSKFDAVDVLDAIQRYGVTRFSVVPTMLVKMLHAPDAESYDVSSLEIVFSGGAILPNEVRVAFERMFGCKVLDGYGLSECAPTACGYYDHDTIRPGSIGRAIPGVEVRILDETGNEVPRGETGEICIQGPNVMRGYLKDDETTRHTLRGGWLHSGDVGYMNDDGYVFLTDRIKDLIIKGGENISPREIEEALYEHPAVAEVAVLGMPDDTYGETVVAVVALKPGKQATEIELIEHSAKYVTKFKLPARIVFRDSLPKNPTGKIQRRAMKDDLLN